MEHPTREDVVKAAKKFGGRLTRELTNSVLLYFGSDRRIVAFVLEVATPNEWTISTAGERTIMVTVKEIKSESPRFTLNGIPAQRKRL